MMLVSQTELVQTMSHHISDIIKRIEEDKKDTLSLEKRRKVFTHLLSKVQDKLLKTCLHLLNFILKTYEGEYFKFEYKDEVYYIYYDNDNEKITIFEYVYILRHNSFNKQACDNTTLSGFVFNLLDHLSVV